MTDDELAAIQDARSERAWNRVALTTHFTLYGFVAMRSNTTISAGVGDPDDCTRHVVLYRSRGPVAVAALAVRVGVLRRSDQWHEVPWEVLTDDEMRRAYSRAVRKGWLP